MNTAHAEIIAEIAGKLGVPPQWLDALIGFESGYNPQAVNPIPYNKRLVDKGLDVPRHARGLIQFIDSTAQDLGFADSADLVAKLPDFDSQMIGAVYPYLQDAAPFTTEQDFLFSVFFPKYRRASPDKPLPDYVQEVNPGIVTAQDYIDLVNKRMDVTVTENNRGSQPPDNPLRTGGNVAALLALGIGTWLFLKG